MFRGRGWAIAAMVLVGIDLGVRAVEHHRALHLISNTRFGDQPMLRAGAEPYPVDPFHWFAVVETPGYYQTGLVNTWSETVNTNDQDDVIFKPPVTPAVMAAKRSWLGRVYLDWARFPLVEDRGHANLVASDELAPRASGHGGRIPRSQVCLPSPVPERKWGHHQGTERLGLHHPKRSHRRHGHERPRPEMRKFSFVRQADSAVRLGVKINRFQSLIPLRV